MKSSLVKLRAYKLFFFCKLLFIVSTLITPQHKHSRASFILCVAMLLDHKLFRPQTRAQSLITRCQRGGETTLVHRYVLYFKDFLTSNQVHLLWSDSSGQEEPGTSEFTVIKSRSLWAAS